VLKRLLLQEPTCDPWSQVVDRSSSTFIYLPTARRHWYHGAEADKRSTAPEKLDQFADQQRLLYCCDVDSMGDRYGLRYCRRICHVAGLYVARVNGL
jgi:hypothetical protein